MSRRPRVFQRLHQPRHDHVVRGAGEEGKTLGAQRQRCLSGGFPWWYLWARTPLGNASGACEGCLTQTPAIEVPLGTPATTRVAGRGAAWWVRAAQVGILAGAGYYLIRLALPYWPAIQARRLTWHAIPLLAGSLLVWANLALLLAAWTVSLRWCAQRIRYRDAARVWFTANLARFLPGAVWQFASLAVMSTRYGLSTMAATATVLLEQVVLLFTGLLVLAALTPSVLHATWWQAALVVATILGAVALAVPRPGGRLGLWIETRVPAVRLVWSQLGPAQLGAFTLMLALPWLLYGVAFRLLALGLLDHPAGSWSDYVVAFTGSYVAGIIAVFAPAGLLVREAALVKALMTVGVGGADAVILAVASRVWLTLLELSAGAVVMALPGGLPPGDA